MKGEAGSEQNLSLLTKVGSFSLLAEVRFVFLGTL